MDWLWNGFWALWIVAVSLVLVYGWVIFFGAPYIPTLKRERQAALKLIDLKPGQTFVDLGCGDGGLLVLAAQQGLLAVGYELNPFLALLAWLRTRQYGHRVIVRWGNFWRADLSRADGVFVFLISHYMTKLDRLIDDQPHGRLKVVSNAFKIPGRKAVKKVGSLYLYIYPGTV